MTNYHKTRTAGQQENHPACLAAIFVRNSGQKRGTTLNHLRVVFRREEILLIIYGIGIIANKPGNFSVRIIKDIYG
jgi:hypothetical protein